MKITIIILFITNFIYGQIEFKDIETALKTPEKVTRLNLQWIKSIDRIPKEVFLFKNLKELQFAVNPNLKNNLDGLGKLTQLEKLVISTSNTTIIPDSIKYLKELKSLAIQHNGITEIPECICELKKLEYLYLNSNLIEKIPDCLRSLKNIEYLDLSGNRLSDNKIIELGSYLPALKINYSVFENSRIQNLRDNIEFKVNKGKYYLKISAIKNEVSLNNYSPNTNSVIGEIIKSIDGCSNYGNNDCFILKMNREIVLSFKSKNYHTKYIVVRGLYKEQPIRRYANKTTASIAFIIDETLLKDKDLNIDKVIFSGIANVTEIIK